MNIKHNVVKTWWEIDTVFDLNPNITYRFRVQAESQEAARIAAAEKLPEGNSIRSITPVDDDFPVIDIPADAERI